MENFKLKESKNLISSIFVSAMLCLLATTANAQKNDLLVFNHNFETRSYRSLSTNPKSDYLVKVSEKGQSAYLSALQQRVINFDITKLEEYSIEEPSTYNVVFKEKKASVYAKYDKNGNLVSSIERHVNIKIPSAISQKIAKQFPGWSFEKSIYSVKYHKHSGSERTIKVFLKKGGQKKIVKMELD
ncbi:hypothetical protein [Flagellimonas sp. S3867]|uniref:hypothetical protein n=1 Tax=Flagellimonas sp. S3867 TaxID=2768063 RepID=UPI001682551E|nr:hypothetical protein [Flagellimonas sp. S3867]